MVEANYAELKANGFLPQRQKDYFAMRLRSTGGRISSEQLETVRRASEKFGRGYIHLTSRQGIEIPFIHLDDIDAVKQFLKEGGVDVGLSGARLRTITACQGSEICRSGLIDTARLAREFDEKFGGRQLPHKFKIGLTGCHNNCLKAEENDLGVKGAVKPDWIAETCVFCGKCQAVCPQKAITVDRKNRTVEIDREKCFLCGRCINSCPKSAWHGEVGFMIGFGGTFGNRVAIGKNILPLVFGEEKLHAIVETTLNYFAENAKRGERLKDVLDRLGWDEFTAKLQSVL